jgi:hypothetical protein
LNSACNPAYLRNGAHVASADLRLADKWACQFRTARARRERCVDDFIDVIEDAVAHGDTEKLGHYLSLLDAALAGQPQLPKLDAIYHSDKHDIAEDLAALEYRRAPSKQTARAWLDALGKESRGNEPLMNCLRLEWEL